MQRNHIPYHPSTNGLAERAVQSFKQALRMNTTGSIHDRLQRFLFKYRITPHSTTGISPAELLFGRRPHSILDCFQPEINMKVELKQNQQKQYHDPSKKLRPQDKVLVEKFDSNPHKWLPGQVEAITGPCSYRIKLSANCSSACRPHSS